MLNFGGGTIVYSVRTGKYLNIEPVEISGIEFLIPVRDMHCGNWWHEEVNVTKGVQSCTKQFIMMVNNVGLFSGASSDLYKRIHEKTVEVIHKY